MSGQAPKTPGKTEDETLSPERLRRVLKVLGTLNNMLPHTVDRKQLLELSEEDLTETKALTAALTDSADPNDKAFSGMSVDRKMGMLEERQRRASQPAVSDEMMPVDRMVDVEDTEQARNAYVRWLTTAWDHWGQSA